MIKNGHTFENIKDYTAAQIKLFEQSILVLEAQERSALIHDLSIAAQGDGKTIKKAIKMLDNYG